MIYKSSGNKNANTGGWIIRYIIHKHGGTVMGDRGSA